MSRESVIEDINSRIGNTEVVNGILTFTLINSSSEEVSDLRRILLTKIPTYTIDIAVFDDNDSCLEDTEIAHRLGLCVLNQQFLPKNKKDPIEFDFKGPIDVNIKDIIVAGTSVNIVTLRKNEKLNGVCYLREGTGDIHAKFSPIFKVAAIPSDNSEWNFLCGLTGAYDESTILDMAVELLADEKISKQQSSQYRYK